MTATLADLLHLVDRAEKGTLLAEEAVQLRRGLREWASALEQARRTAGGLQAEIRRLRGQEAAVRPSAASSAPGPRTSAVGASGGDAAAFNGPGKPPSHPGDSRTDPSEAENALRGGSPGLAASARPSLPPGP